LVGLVCLSDSRVERGAAIISGRFLRCSSIDRINGHAPFPICQQN
jgi:hypothetical protein